MRFFRVHLGSLDPRDWFRSPTCTHSPQLHAHDPGPQVTSFTQRCPRCLQMVEFTRQRAH